MSKGANKAIRAPPLRLLRELILLRELLLRELLLTRITVEQSGGHPLSFLEWRDTPAAHREVVVDRIGDAYATDQITDFLYQTVVKIENLAICN